MFVLFLKRVEEKDFKRLFVSVSTNNSAGVDSQYLKHQIRCNCQHIFTFNISFGSTEDMVICYIKKVNQINKI